MGWVPTDIKASPKHEPRNGLLMCLTHRAAFYDLLFFIRYEPTVSFIFLCNCVATNENQTKRYIFVHNDSGGRCRFLKQFHNKAIGLDFEDIHAPLPLLFLVHEYMARGKNFYQTTSDTQVSVGWQGWIIDEGAVNEQDDGSFFFNRKATSAKKA
jgi:hypothetical protein